jgi:dolichyl-phosphate-mannose--protein O-mannosyl transferase
MGRVTYLHHYVCPPVMVSYLFPPCLLLPSPAAPHGPPSQPHPLPPPLALSRSHPANKQLPTLWFAVLMAGHVLNHLLFDSQRLSPGARFIWFALWTGSVIVNFWWFKDFALGIYGPVNDHKGWLWRGSWNVSPKRLSSSGRVRC